MTNVQIWAKQILLLLPNKKDILRYNFLKMAKQSVESFSLPYTDLSDQLTLGYFYRNNVLILEVLFHFIVICQF